MKIGKFISVILLGSLALLGMQSTLAEESQNAFISGDLDLKPDPDRAGVYLQLKPDLDLSGYRSVLITPVEIWIHPDSEYKGLGTDVVKKVGDGIVQIITDELSPDYPIVNDIGPKTLVLRLAVIGIRVKEEGKGFSVLNVNSLKRISLVDAGIGAEVLDGETGERLAVLVDTGISRSLPVNEKDGLSWEEVEMSLRFYAKRFHSRLNGM